MEPLHIRVRLWVAFRLLRLAEHIAGGIVYRHEEDKWEVWS
jgi:hypothetical protein